MVAVIPVRRKRGYTADDSGPCSSGTASCWFASRWPPRRSESNDEITKSIVILVTQKKYQSYHKIFTTGPTKTWQRKAYLISAHDGRVALVAVP